MKVGTPVLLNCPYYTQAANDSVVATVIDYDVFENIVTVAIHWGYDENDPYSNPEDGLFCSEELFFDYETEEIHGSW